MAKAERIIRTRRLDQLIRDVGRGIFDRWTGRDADAAEVYVSEIVHTGGGLVIRVFKKDRMKAEREAAKRGVTIPG